MGLNHTEAYQLCRAAGIKCHPREGRATLIDYLLGIAQPTAVGDVNQLDAWRHGIAGFVLDHWITLQPQLTCPIRSGDPRSCFGCLDTQVIECVVKNSANERLIALHKRTE